MPVFLLDPLCDPRWADLVSRHPRASVFHTPGWLEALRRTYGYEPFALTTTDHGPLDNGLVVCRVRTWLSRRLVSLPFSDHCDPLVDRTEDFAEILAFLKQELSGGSWRAVELRSSVPRGVTSVAQGFSPADHYFLHTLDLSRPLDQIFAGFHPSHTQRAIRRAEREGIRHEAGRSDQHLSDFYRLLRASRRRHGLPPQPIAWFRNLIDCLPEAVTIHLARLRSEPVAGVLTLSFKKTLVYKYGGSNDRYHRFGAMQLLFWRAIQAAKAGGRLENLDLGRTDLDQPGLLAFKDHLGAARSPLAYYRWPADKARPLENGTLSRAARRVAAHVPDAALDLTGRLVYRHLG